MENMAIWGYLRYTKSSPNVQKECAERNFHFQQGLGALKGQHFEKIEWGVIYVLACDEQFKNLIFWISLKLKLLYANTENTLNGKINTKSVYISDNLR
jgi:hypothetical protein